MFRRTSAAFAVLALSTLSLVACSSGPTTASCVRADSDASVLDFAHAKGSFGKPVVSLVAPVYATETIFTDLEQGDGRRVTSDVQDVGFSISIVSGATGQNIVNTAAPAQSLEKWRTDFPGLATLMDCASEGSRIVGAIPASDLSPVVAQGWGLTEDQAAVVTLDVTKVYPGAADGAPQYNDRPGMPSVVLAPDGRPGIIVPNSAPPADLAVEVLKRGTGAAVKASDTVRVKYTGVDWGTQKVFDSTWEKGASASLSLSGVVPGFAQALEGATVGSQLLVVIPPELGYGAQGSGSVPANATLIFVVDVLGIDDAPAATP